MSDAAAVSDALELSVSAWSDPGRSRSENQDYFLVADLSVRDGGVLFEPDAEAPGSGARVRPGARGLRAMVADGMGGAAGGRIASHFAVAWTLRELQARLDAEEAPTGPGAVVSALKASLEAANTRVHEQGARTPEYSGMGSTATAVLVLGGAYYAAQVGDSRAYVVRAGASHRLTRDQSLVQTLVDAGAMTPEEALRSPHGSVLLQALGTGTSVAVELTWAPACRGDLLLLCSDGLYRVVREDELGAAAAAHPDPATLCRTLVETANERGGPDNVTVVAVRVEGDSLPPPAGGGTALLQPYDPAAR